MNTDTINISIHSALSPRVGLTHQFFLFMIPIMPLCKQAQWDSGNGETITKLKDNDIVGDSRGVKSHWTPLIHLNITRSLKKNGK